MQKNILLPQVELTMEDVTVVNWLVKVGDRVQPDQNILEVESQKGVVEVPSPEAGYVRKLCVTAGESIKEKALLCILTDTTEEAVKEVGLVTGRPAVGRSAGSGAEFDETPHAVLPRQTHAQPRESTSPQPGEPGAIRAAPAARKLAKDLGLDLATVRGTGPEGRITVADVERAPTSTQSVGEVRSHAEHGNEGGAGEGTPLPKARLALVAQMQRALVEIPQFNVTRQMDVGPLLVKAAGITFTHRLACAVAQALGKHPALRSVINGDRIRVLPVSVAVAMETTHGLIAPAIRGADQLRVAQIAERLTDLRARAEAGRVKRDELIDAPFAISNLGMLGIDLFTPFVFHGQTAVLAIGRAVDGRAWFTLAVDHRVVDGAEAARFLETLQSEICPRNTPKDAK